MTVQILIGDCRDKLRELPEASVNCCVTSPPYFGLRDYGTAQWGGGDDSCDHMERIAAQAHKSSTLGPNRDGLKPENAAFKAIERQFLKECGKCGATRIDRQMGLEPTPDEFVAGMVEVFREVRRVLRDDGTLWLNIGDSYAGGGNYRGNSELSAKQRSNGGAHGQVGATPIPIGCKAKDLIGIPWLLAFALRADGWYLRQDIIWSKPNPMPESVRDRCTKAHEYLFLLSKGPRYYYDAEAIAEPSETAGDVKNTRTGSGWVEGQRRAVVCPETRNKRSVWEVATQPFSEAHFATYPPALIEPCILAGCPDKCCAKCGAAWRKIIEGTAPDGRKAILTDGRTGRDEDGNPLIGNNMTHPGEKGSFNAARGVISKQVIGSEPGCDCGAGFVAGTVLDPFGGAGTTGLVADRLSRNAILIELNPEYAAIAEKRLNGDGGLFADVKVAA